MFCAIATTQVIGDSASHLETALSIKKSTLLELQGRCKKEPDGYRDDFLVHREHFLALLRVLGADNEGGAGAVAQLTALVSFLAQVRGRALGEERIGCEFHAG